MDFYFIYFQSPSPQSPTDHPPYSHPPYSKPHYKIVSSLTIHPFINQLMSNGIVKPFLHKNLSSTVSSLSPVLVPPPMWSMARSDFQLREADSQPTNYKCGILPGRTDPFPSCCPLTGTTFPPPSMPQCQWLLIFLSKTHQSHPSTTPSHPFPPLVYRLAYRPHSHF